MDHIQAADEGLGARDPPEQFPRFLGHIAAVWDFNDAASPRIVEELLESGRRSPGFEFPDTPYKFFLDHTGENRDMTELAGIAFPWTGRCENYYGSPGVTFFERAFKTLFVDANRAGACDIVCVVLLESVARAHEMGFVGGPIEVLLQHAYYLADAARKRMRTILNEGSSC